MIKSIIAAVAENGVIGNKNTLLWHLGDDMKHFRKITMGHYILMGRKTFESIGRPLAGRTNIVISGNTAFQQPGIQVMDSLERAFKFSEETKQDEIFIIGGAEIYRQSINHADKIYYTKVNSSVSGDVFFPPVNWDNWAAKILFEFGKNDINDFSFQILELVRNINYIRDVGPRFSRN